MGHPVIPAQFILGPDVEATEHDVLETLPEVVVEEEINSIVSETTSVKKIRRCSWDGRTSWEMCEKESE